MREWDGEERYRSKIRRPASIIILIPITFMCINIVIYCLKTDIPGKVSLDSFPSTERRKLLMNTGGEETNCTNPAVLDFPRVVFPGGKFGQLILPFIFSIYTYILLARVCDRYFIASIKIICSNIGFSGDVAGATLMAAATSSPELFVNMVGTFVTAGNIGVGTIIGSAVFNILAVPGLCSVFAVSKLNSFNLSDKADAFLMDPPSITGGSIFMQLMVDPSRKFLYKNILSGTTDKRQVIKLDWWPLIRDSLAYCISLFILCFVLRDGVVQWYEALMMVVSYGFYLVIMHYNNIFRDIFDIHCDFNKNSAMGARVWEEAEASPLLKTKEVNGNVIYNGEALEGNEYVNEEEEVEASRESCCWPTNSSIISKIWYTLTFPISIFLACTIPNSKTWPKLYMLTFTMCICWIAVGSYFIAWMITISGYVLKIPDSVMGLTFIAAGMCIPETISSIIVSKQGHGSMALANALGSNVFDTLFCIGLPWLIKTTYFMDDESVDHSIEVDSTRLEYDTLILLITLVLLFTIVTVNKFQLTRIGGYTCLLMYFIFIGCTVGIELQAHFTSDALPLCDIDN